MASSRIPWVALTATAVSAGVSYVLYNSVSEYGLEGTLRYIWEGDPYGPGIRDYVAVLGKAEKSRVNLDIRISQIEEALERARLDGVDDGKRTTKEMVRLWVVNYLPLNLEKSLAGLSNDLDRLAAQVDGVLISAKDGHGSSKVLEDLRRRKKVLSKQIVLQMERCDALTASYQVLQNPDQ